MIKLLLIFFLIPIAFLLLLGISLFRIFARFFLGSRSNRQSPFSTADQPRQASGPASSATAGSHAKQLHKHYGKEDGEYVDFEEIIDKE